MKAGKCKSCEYELEGWVEFCPNCAEPIENYARPAGFWIRVGAHIIDSVIFFPLGGLAMWNMFALKSIPDNKRPTNQGMAVAHVLIDEPQSQ